MKDLNYWIEHLELKSHPEGGWYKEVYRSEEEIPVNGLPVRYKGSRSFSTSIYYLLEKGQISALHRIQSDEQWHFYAGSPLSVFIIHPNGILENLVIGSNPEKGEVFQGVVKAGCWFGSMVEEGYALVGCTVSPGFDFADFELGKREELLHQYPQHKEIILRLTH